MLKMKRQIKETSIISGRGPVRIITYGYNTQVDGLDVIRTIDKKGKKFTIVHRKSGISLGVYFPSAIRGAKFANKYLKDFDFTQYANDLLRDGKLGKCIYSAKITEGL